MKEKISIREHSILAIALIFVLLMSWNSLSYTGFIKLSHTAKIMIWVVCQNGLPLSVILLAGFLMPKIKLFLNLIFMPYFVTRFVFDYTTYLQKYICSKEAWGWIFSVELVSFFVISLIIYVVLCNKGDENNSIL